MNVKMLHNNTPLSKGLKVFFIMLPLFLGIIWLVSVAKNRVTVIATETGLKLSPSQNTKPVITGLIIFNLGYIIFIVLMFKSEMRDFFTEFSKKKRHL